MKQPKSILCLVVTLITTPWSWSQPTTNRVSLPDGSVYDGSFSNGLFDGRGVLLYGDGDRYQGEFKDGVRHGTGIYSMPDGRMYKGKFCDGEYEGTGVFIYATGDRYEGEFKNGLFDGKGILRYANGDTYKGKFRAGEIADESGTDSEHLRRFPRVPLLLGLLVSLIINIVLMLRLRHRRSSKHHSAVHGPEQQITDNRSDAALRQEEVATAEMKMAFTAPSVVPCDFLKSMLEAVGIPCVIRNEYGTHLLCYGLPVPGGSALAWAWPEVWIPEEDVERAESILKEFKESYRREHNEPATSQPEDS